MVISDEVKLALLVWILYAIECVHWLKSTEVGFSLSIGGRWLRSSRARNSYTLLGYVPCFQFPRPTIAGWAKAPRETTHLKSRVLSAAGLCKEQTWLRSVIAIQHIIVLLLLPLILLGGLLMLLWKPLVALILCLHLVIVVLFILARRRIGSLNGDAIGECVAVALNPVAALRCLDRLMQAEVDRQR